MCIPRLLAVAAVLAASAPHAAAQIDPVDLAAAGAWSYAGPTAPAFWASRLGYAECAGPRQSPVDLPAGHAQDPLPVTLDYPAGNPARLVNTGHTVNLLLGNRATLQVDGTTYDFHEMHFHVPAEHLVQGTRYAAEIHAVHQLGDGDRVVLTTFVRTGAYNRGWEALIAGLPGNRGDANEIGASDLMALLSLGNLASEWMYSYEGSLTTPLCTPNVRFLLRRTPIQLSGPQVEALASAFARNVRPVFPVTTPVTLHRGAH